MSVASNRVRAPIETPEMAEALRRIEERLAGQIRSREPLLSDIAGYLIGSGGKRVRPIVAVLIYRACGGDNLDDIVDIAATLELIHSASLLHDDIIDASEVRRGQDSALRKYGVANTLVAGDFIFARAYQLCARFDERLIGWAIEACICLTEGEIMQARFRHNDGVTLADYLEIIDRKTASIFSQGARTAAALARARPELVEAMYHCGYNVGMAFQITDDLLDVEGSEARVGKPVGLDLRDGNPSLPVVLALRQDPEVARIFRLPTPTPAEIAAALARIRASGVLAEVRTLATTYATRALECAAGLPPSGEREQLLILIRQLIQRAE